MIIDPNKLEEVTLENFKGGKGNLITRNFADDKCKIMFSHLCPGASSGEHTHVGNSEIVYVIDGTATFYYDGKKEICEKGEAHYCPEGHSHYMVNDTDKDLYYFAIVPEHRCK